MRHRFEHRWRAGQVENQVGLVRERFFTPRLRFKSYAELNAWLEDRCLAHARRAAHPERKDRTIWEVFEEVDRPALIAYRGRFDGFHALPAAVSKTLLVRFDYNKYSVHAKAAGRPVDIHAYADRRCCQSSANRSPLGSPRAMKLAA